MLKTSAKLPGGGGFNCHIAAPETARRHNIEVVIVVKNNSAITAR